MDNGISSSLQRFRVATARNQFPVALSHDIHLSETQSPSSLEDPAQAAPIANVANKILQAFLPAFNNNLLATFGRIAETGAEFDRNASAPRILCEQRNCSHLPLELAARR